MNAHDYEGALRAIEQMLPAASTPKESDELGLLHAQLLMATSRDEDAFNVVDHILATSTNPDILHQAAGRYFTVARNGGFLENAIARQQERVDASPTSVTALEVMAQFYQYAQQKENELRARQALSDIAVTPENLARLAELQTQLGRYEQASASMSRLADLQP